MQTRSNHWLAIGAGLGTVLAAVTDHNIGIGVALGAGIGLAIGQVMGRSSDKEQATAGTSHSPEE